MSKVKKTFEAALKDRIDSYDDQELRAECIEAGLKPGPVNSQTRSGWAKRLLSKRLKESSKPKEIKEITSEFSADEDAINGETAEPVESAPVQENVKVPEDNLKDPEFSDDDAPVEESEKDVMEESSKLEETSNEKSAETPENESMLVNISKTADTSSMEVEAKISSEAREPENSEEKPDLNTEPTESETVPENTSCKMGEAIVCIKDKFDEAAEYLKAHKEEIVDLVIVLLIAYILFKFKDDINDNFDTLNEKVSVFFKELKNQIEGIKMPKQPVTVDDPVIEVVE